MNKKIKTRGFRNNNPLNIRKGVSRWEGRAKEQNDAEFVTFCSMAMGYRAAWKLMDTYRLRLHKQGMSYTLHNIIHSWAPPAEGNDATAYIRAVVHILENLGGEEWLRTPSSPLGAQVMARILAAMTCVENGIVYKDVPRHAIVKGFQLAFPGEEPLQVEW